MWLASTSGRASSGNGPAPLLPLSASVPPMFVLWLTSTPPWLFWRLTDPLIELAAQASSDGSPISTNPVAPETVTEGFAVEPHSEKAVGLLALMTLATCELMMTIPVPEPAVTDPLTVAFTTHHVPPPDAEIEPTVPVRVWVQATTLACEL